MIGTNEADQFIVTDTPMEIDRHGPSRVNSMSNTRQANSSTGAKSMSREKMISTYDVNVRSVYAATSVGNGRKGMQTLCGIFDLPKPVSSMSY